MHISESNYFVFAVFSCVLMLFLVVRSFSWIRIINIPAIDLAHMVLHRLSYMGRRRELGEGSLSLSDTGGRTGKVNVGWILVLFPW